MQALPWLSWAYSFSLDNPIVVDNDGSEVKVELWHDPRDPDGYYSQTLKRLSNAGASDPSEFHEVWSVSLQNVKNDNLAKGSRDFIIPGSEVSKVLLGIQNATVTATGGAVRAEVEQSCNYLCTMETPVVANSNLDNVEDIKVRLRQDPTNRFTPTIVIEWPSLNFEERVSVHPSTSAEMTERYSL